MKRIETVFDVRSREDVKNIHMKHRIINNFYSGIKCFNTEVFRVKMRDIINGVLYVDIERHIDRLERRHGK